MDLSESCQQQVGDLDQILLESSHKDREEQQYSIIKSELINNQESLNKVEIGAPIISNNEDQTSVVTPFLVKHISELVSGDNFHKYCYRHNPDITCNKMTDNIKMKRIQLELDKLPSRDRQAISHVWSIFSAAPTIQRQLILQGLLTQCCFPQLSCISQEVASLIKLDFISTLPMEISLKILCYLDCKSLCNAAQVCRKWKLLADDDRVWHYMCEQHIDRKCPNCGWGLPLMHMKRAREMTIDRKRKIEAVDDNTENENNVSNDNVSINNQNSDNSQDGISNNSNNNNISTNYNSDKIVDSQPPQKKLRKRPWKSVYSERFKLEKNWRKGIYSIKEFIGHKDGVTCLQFNSKYLMTGSYDTTIKIWKVETGECIRTLIGHTKGVRALVFDSTKLITGGLDSTIKVWNYHNGNCIATYRGHEDAVVSVDANEKLIVSGSADHTVKVWHVDTRTCYTLRGHTDWANYVKIHPQSNTAFSASDDTTIRMWDLNTNECLRIFGGMENNGHIGQVQCVIPFTYKENLVEDNSESDLELNNTNSRQFENVDDECNEVSDQDPFMKPNYPTHLLSSSLDNTIKLWCVKTGKCIRTQFGHIEGVWSINADTFRIISGAHDRLIKVWDLQNGKCLHTFGNSSSVSCVALSDSRFAAGLEDGTVKMYCFDEK